MNVTYPPTPILVSLTSMNVHQVNLTPISLNSMRKFLPCMTDFKMFVLSPTNPKEENKTKQKQNNKIKNNITSLIKKIQTL